MWNKDSHKYRTECLLVGLFLATLISIRYFHDQCGRRGWILLVRGGLPFWMEGLALILGPGFAVEGKVQFSVIGKALAPVPLPKLSLKGVPETRYNESYARGKLISILLVLDRAAPVLLIMNYYFSFHVQGDHRSFEVHSGASRDDFALQGISFVKYVRVGFVILGFLSSRLRANPFQGSQRG
ncbi:hypothetical protein U1Q18_026058 [Sarracenia purpurea var. burkii]